jgi:hypothetical protein
MKYRMPNVDSVRHFFQTTTGNRVQMLQIEAIEAMRCTSRGGTMERQAQNTQARTEALRLLAPFLALPADHSRSVLTAVEAIVTDLFPTLSHELPRGSTQASDYGLQLMAMMDAAVAAAENGTHIEAFLEVRLPLCAVLAVLITPLLIMRLRHWHVMASLLARHQGVCSPHSTTLQILVDNIGPVEHMEQSCCCCPCSGPAAHPPRDGHAAGACQAA